jgi:para-nitrobenzyl esterase
MKYGFALMFWMVCLVSGAQITSCLGDLNNSGTIEVNDVLNLLGGFGCSTDCGAADLNDDGAVNVEDVLMQLAVFGGSCPTVVPQVWADSTFGISFQENLIYGQGFAHEDWGGPIIDTIHLGLDAYIPDNEELLRPALVLIHGGGFFGGSSSVNALVDLAHSYASRGWVVFSINYRLSGDRGTVPSSWLYAVSQLPDGVDANQALAMYPANRDARAALRWAKHNAEAYNIDPGYISVLGGSAGAFISVALGVANQDDYLSELSVEEDPSLLSTHLEETFELRCILDFWGGRASVDILDALDSGDRFDSADVPIMIIHGTEDPAVLFSESESIFAEYSATGVPCAFYPIEGEGHSIWQSNYEGIPFWQLGYDFMVEQQALQIQN